MAGVINWPVTSFGHGIDDADPQFNRALDAAGCRSSSSSSEPAEDVARIAVDQLAGFGQLQLAGPSCETVVVRSPLRVN